jgi:hypothetical protein
MLTPSVQMPRSMLKSMLKSRHRMCVGVSVFVCVGVGVGACQCVGVCVCLSVCAGVCFVCLQMLKSVQIPRSVLRPVLTSKHRCSDQCTDAQASVCGVGVRVCVCVCGCGSVCLCVCLCQCVSVCAVFVVCAVRVVCVCVVCVGVRVGVYVCLCVLRVHMSMHPALYDCQDVQHTGKQHRCKILGWVFCCVVDLNYTSGNTTTAVTLLQVNVNWLCR